MVARRDGVKGNVFAIRECPPGCQCEYLTPGGAPSTMGAQGVIIADN